MKHTFGRSTRLPSEHSAAKLRLPFISMRKIVLPAVVVALAAPGCQAWTGASATARPDEGGDARSERTSAIYAAVIRQLVTKDHFLGEEPTPFERVFVVRTAGNPYVRTESPPRPVSSAVERGIVEALRDLPPVSLVADPDTVIVDEKSCRGPAVRRGGLLISLGPIATARREAVTVASFLVSGCLGKNGQWLTYVLEPAGGSWRVVGTQGPIAIS
jgi:hypothetical protein